MAKANFRSEKEKLLNKFPEIDWHFTKITVNSIDACTFVIATQQEEIFWIFDFVGEKEANGLK